jgi:hypothetical protein
MKALLPLMIIIAGIISCKSKSNQFTVQTNGRIVLIDSSAPAVNFWPYNPKERWGYFPVYYIGRLSDTIRLGPRKIFRYSNRQKDYSSFRNFAIADSSKLRIKVDTAFSVAHTIDYFNDPSSNKRRIIDSTKSYKSFPIFVFNLCDSLISVGIFAELGYTARQVKDGSGRWIDIETLIPFACSFGARDIIIEPHQVLVAMLPRYLGSYKAECRLKFSFGNKEVYSNVYEDYINEKQLTDTLIKNDY